MKSWLRIGLAILVIVAVVTVGFRLRYAANPLSLTVNFFSHLFNKKSPLYSSLRGDVVTAPELTGITQWFNTPGGAPLTLAELRGKVVMVDFWTYSCINCIRNIPHVTAWDRKYRDSGLVIIGVHTPEFAFEKIPQNVAKKVKEYGIEYPVALDNDYATWNAYANQFWPAKYFINHEGEIVWRKFGEGGYEEQEKKIQELLAAAGTLREPMPVASPPNGIDFSQIGTPEIYLGYERISHFGGRVMPDREVTFSGEQQTVDDNTFYLTGTWLMGPQSVTLRSATGKIIIRYRANKANLVMAADGEIVAEVRLDGEALNPANRGSDVFLTKRAGSFVRIQESKLYNLTDTGAVYGWHTLELIISQPGVSAFAFTFG